MGRAGSFVLLLAVALVVPSPPARAFDGQRRGLGLELGLGAGAIPAEDLYARSGFLGGYQDEVYRERGSLWTRVRAGWGLGDRWLLQCVNDVGWTSTDLRNERSVVYATGSTGLGATYFFRGSAPSFTIEAGLGFSSSYQLGTSSGEAHRGSGPALWGGVGYELSPGWLVRATVGWAGAAEEWISFSSEPDPNQTTAVGVTIDRAWY